MSLIQNVRVRGFQKECINLAYIFLFPENAASLTTDFSELIFPDDIRFPVPEKGITYSVSLKNDLLIP